MPDLIRTQVAIVGGGPAGSTLAWALGRAGVESVVIDRAEFPRDKVCAGWITPAVVQELDLDLDQYARERVLQPIHAFRIGVIGGREIETPRETRPVSYGIRRCEFDDYLLRRSGARLELGRPLRELRRSAGGWTIDGRIHAKLLVGAGGHFCPVARVLGARPGKTEPAILAQEIEFPLDTGSGDDLPDDIPRLLFCADLRGYGWVFRKGGWLNVGLGRDDPHGLSAHVTAFVEGMRRSGRIPSGTPSKLRGHAYLLRDHAPRRSYDEATMLIGDAAGLAYPQSGEGIRPAVESAILAAEVIVAARGDYRRTRLADYESKLDARFGRRRNRAHGTERFAAPVKRVLGRRLLALPWFASRVVVDRWFLHRDVPPLSGAA